MTVSQYYHGRFSHSQHDQTISNGLKHYNRYIYYTFFPRRKKNYNINIINICINIILKQKKRPCRVNGLLHHPTSRSPHPTSVGPSGQGHGEAFHVAAGPQGILRSCLAVFFPGLKGKNLPISRVYSGGKSRFVYPILGTENPPYKKTSGNLT